MEAPEVFDKRCPPIRFSLATVFFLFAVLCVLLAEYQAWGIEAVLAWWFTLLPIAAYLMHRRREWYLRNLAIGAFAVSGFWFLLPSLAHPQWTYYPTACSRNLRDLALAADEYSVKRGTLPQPNTPASDGKPGLSWRVTLLPFLGYDHLFKMFDTTQPWDHPTNRRLVDRSTPAFRCPAETNQRSFETSYVAIIGDDTCWPTTPITTSHIKDGTSNTILFTETHESGILWPEPRDLEYDKLDWRIHGTPGNSISSSHGPVVRYFDGSRRLKQRTCVNVAMADGGTRRLTADVDPEVLRQMVNRRDGLPKPEDMP